MRLKKISDLPAASALTGAELIEMVQDGRNVKIPVLSLMAAPAGGHVVDLGSATTSFTMSSTSGGLFKVKLGSPQCSAVLISTNNATMTVLIEQGTGANKVLWPSSVAWPHGTPPLLSYKKGQVDVITLKTFDAGLSWQGFFPGGGF